MKKKTLMMIGAGPDQTFGILKAKKMGLRVLATDANKNAPGFAFVDDFAIASVYDSNASLKAAEILNTKYKLDSVMTLGIDIPLIVAKIAAKCSLPGPSLKTAYLASNKYLMKKQFAKYNIPIPWFEKVKSLKELKKIIGKRGFPIVIKPVDSRGARGVLLITKKVDLGWAFRESISYSSLGELIVEEYLFGPQISTESVIYDNFATTPGFSDRNYEYIEKYTPFMIENGGTLPSRLSYTAQTAVKRTAEAAARTLGINRWTAKGDMVLTEEGPKVIEIAARISGGFFATVKIPHNTGVDFVRAAILMALGQKPDFEDLKIKYHRHITQRYFFLPAGKIKRIKGIEKLKETRWVKHFSIWVKEGTELFEVRHMGSRCGMVTVTGKSRAEVTKRVKKAIKMVKFEISKNGSG